MEHKIFDLSEFQEHWFDLLMDIQNRVEVVLTRDGVPVATVSPLLDQPKIMPQAGLNRGSMIMADGFDEPLSELASIQVETQRLSKHSLPVDDGALKDLSPWVRGLLGVIEDTGEFLDDVYVDYLEKKYA